MPGKELVPRPAVPPPVVTTPPWQPQDKDLVPAYRWLWQRRHWTVPVFLLPGLWLAALTLHLLHYATYTLLAGGIVAVITVLGAHLKWDRVSEQWYARLTVVAAWLWLWIGAWLGPAHLWPFVALASAVAVWGYFWWRHKRPRGHRRRQKLLGKWDAWWQSHCWNWNLGGSKVIAVWPMGVTTKVRIQGIAGRHSIQHVKQVMHLIESGADGHADTGMIRAEVVKGKPSQFDLFFKKENPLRGIVEYDMSLAPRSVHEQMVAGMSETGVWKTITPRRNRFVIGETRSGKSNDLLVGLAALTGCPDSRQILIDLKAGRSARPVLAAAAVEYVVTEVDEARMLLRMLTAETAARSKYAYTGEEQLLATDEVPALHLMIDETNGLTSVANGDTECVRLLGTVTSQGNGLEIYTWVYTQHGSLEESVRTEQIRGNLHVRSVYRVAEARHGAYVIPEYNKLDASKLEEKGTCYIKDGKDATPEQVRAPHMPHPLLKKIAAQNARLLDGRPPLTLYCGSQIAAGDMTWQQWWDSRWGRLDEAFHALSPQYQEWAALQSARSPAEAFAATEAARAAAAPAGPLPANPGEGDAASAAERIRRELADAHRGVPGNFVPPKVNLRPVITRQKGTFATALESAPPEGISPTQLMDESGMSSAWVYQKLSGLVEAGVATKLGRGRYAPVAGGDIREAMSVLDAGNEQLYREARETVDAG
jgi:hypothetical protein